MGGGCAARAKALYKRPSPARRIDDLAPLLTREGGKPLGVSRAEVLRGADALEYYAGLARNVYGRTVDGPNQMALLMREPIGVGCRSSSLEHGALAAHTVAGARAGGGERRSDQASQPDAGRDRRVHALIDEIREIPKGIVNYVIGPGSARRRAGQAPRRGHGGFTGDTEHRQGIMRMAADTLKKVVARAGRQVAEHRIRRCRFDRAIRGAITGASLFHAGQVCVAGSRSSSRRTSTTAS